MYQVILSVGTITRQLRTFCLLSTPTVVDNFRFNFVIAQEAFYERAWDWSNAIFRGLPNVIITKY